MKRLIVLLYFAHFMSCAQNEPIQIPQESEMVSMNDTNLEYGGSRLRTVLVLFSGCLEQEVLARLFVCTLRNMTQRTSRCQRAKL